MRPGHDLTRIRGVLGAAGWTTFDQVLFSLSNLVVTLAVARAGGAEGLGRYAVAFAAYLVVLGFSRSLVSEPLLALPRGVGNHKAEQAAGTLTLMVGLPATVIVAGVGLLLGRPELLVVAVALPVTLLHDLLRYQSFWRKRPQLATLLDGGWLLGSVAAWPVLTSAPSPTVALACWGGAALLGTVVGGCFVRPAFASPATALRWWRSETRGLATPLALDSVLVGISTQAVVFVLASSVGDDALGLLRAGQVYFQPILLALVAFGMFLLPRLAQRVTPPSGGLAMRLSVAMAAVTAVVCVGIALAEPLLHTVLYAGSIDVPQALMIPLATQTVLAAAAGALAAVAKACRNAGIIARSRLSSTLIGVVLLVLATTHLGLLGAAWALAVQSAIYLVGLALRIARTTRLNSDRAELARPDRPPMTREEKGYRCQRVGTARSSPVTAAEPRRGR